MQVFLSVTIYWETYSVAAERTEYFQQINQLPNLMNTSVTEKRIWHMIYTEAML